jgi:hypothetical protein
VDHAGLERKLTRVLILQARDMNAESVGDFVRQIKQCIDLMRQIADATDDPEVTSTARAAAAACLRGVVAAARQTPRQTFMLHRDLSPTTVPEPAEEEANDTLHGPAMTRIARLDVSEYTNLNNVARWFIALRWIAVGGVSLVLGVAGIAYPDRKSTRLNSSH